ncbi:carnitine 3-dehydrogenase [Lentisalinibacter salinarum]|uniref:carnitine 3-dehydrogenase n=1 Tax=Lentisalinibacter salinarum TaxID=2992239 RepID=UPI0038690702
MNAATPGRRKAALLGGGVIGGGWAARFLLHGWDVSVCDPHPEAGKRVAEVLANARRSLPALADAPLPPEGELTFCTRLADAVRDADWIQESVPEDLALKHEVIAEVQAAAPPDSILGSSTSGFRPGELRQGSADPGRILVAHPFNPVYLLPLVEVVAGPETDETIVAGAMDLLASIGMHPLRVRREIDAHIADRLLESVWREALWLVRDDIATTAEVDDAIRMGFGLRWAQMGLFETYRLAGGEEGMAHFIRQFGPALKWPWTRLMDVPELDEALVAKIADQSDAQSGDYSIRELEAIRDRNLVGILRTLKERDWGAGRTLNAHDRHLRERAPPAAAQTGGQGPLRLLELAVLPAWIDYNGHMTEYRYVQAFSDSCEALLRRVGMHDEYVAAGCSWYTAETHTQYFDEVGAGASMYSTAQVLATDGKRLHVFYRLHAAEDDRLLATLEAMYLHVNTASGRVEEAAADASGALRQLATAHAALPVPETAGRSVGQRQ